MKRRLIAALMSAVLLTTTLVAQEMVVPTSAQAVLFAKILTFDRELKTRSKKELVVGILYQSWYRPSLVAKDEFQEAFSKPAIQETINLPIRFVPISLTEETDITAAITNSKANVLYIAPLRAVDLKRVIAVTRKIKCLTITGVPQYVDSGVTVGLDVKGEKPLIVVNVTSAKEEGADFHSQLLKLAKIVK
ncbi:MAG: YfiR family protein [Candidatus Poribacteria bacterium]|nr:YfiR family protein [Candidatus Poribacteria bacterium]